MRRILTSLLILILPLVVTSMCWSSDFTDMGWPEKNNEHGPWAYWWWLGSALEKDKLVEVLDLYQDAHMGGLHIVPIYGVKGNEPNNINFISPEWMDLLDFCTAQADKRNIGIDMTTGTGWPFGGPFVDKAHASSGIGYKVYSLSGGQTLGETLDVEKLHVVMAYAAGSAPQNLTSRVNSEGVLNWTAPVGEWELYVLYLTDGVQHVKRAGPGGEGRVVDPFSVDALNFYLGFFDQAFAGYSGKMPRAQYHDSYEYYGADWTDDLFDEFQIRRGYDLRDHLPALFNKDSAEKNARIQNDYRETISDLHKMYIARWVQWCHAKGCQTRNQAHGSPTNLLDCYSLADIPETEMFKKDWQPFVNKMASSSAHIAGKTLVGCESCTWLNEHFQVTLEEVKREIDQLFVSGVNHIIYHGMAYSPLDDPWPGWLFYASTNFAPSNSFWRDLPEWNAYITRAQTILQYGRPDNDALVYFPIHDGWNQGSDSLLFRLSVHGTHWLSFGGLNEVQDILWKKGWGFDYVSEEKLNQALVQDGMLSLNQASYKAVVMPECQYLTVDMLIRLISLAQEGATIIVKNDLPRDVPGYGNLAQRRSEYQTLLKTLDFQDAGDGIAVAAKGFGRFIKGGNLEALMAYANIGREKLVDAGLHFIRRTHPEGCHYFISNFTCDEVDAWIPLGVFAQSVVILDPRHENKTGLAVIRTSEKNQTEVRLQIQPNESLILRTFATRMASGPSWTYLRTRPHLQMPDDLYAVQLSGEPVTMAFIDDVSIARVSSTIDSHDRKAEYLIDGSGLGISGAGTHSINPDGSMWLSDNATGPEDDSIIFDLGGYHDLESVHIWNYNELAHDGQTPLMNRGVQKLDILASNVMANFIKLGTFTLNQAPGSDTMDFGQTIAAKASGVRYVKFDIKSNFGSENYVGLSEVRFRGTNLSAFPVQYTNNTWDVDFIAGGPVLPPSYQTNQLLSWTEQGGETERFAGTARYTTTFTKPDCDADDWILDLGTVYNSASVRLNGQYIGTLFGAPYRIVLGDALKAGENTLQIDVTNLTANRIADMDRRGVYWKKFHEINYVNINYRAFDASSWPIMASGLIGPVKLVPAMEIDRHCLGKISGDINDDCQVDVGDLSYLADNWLN